MKKQQQDDNENNHMYLQYQNMKLSEKCVKLENCGEGGFGTVDAYFDYTLQKVIAVKQVSRKTTYLQEKRRLINMKKKQFEFVNDLIGFCDDERILMFELGEATLLELDDIFQDDGHQWREIDLIYITWSLLVGLKYLREIKSYHGDISPNNIMFFMDKIKYIDLGSSEIDKNSEYLKQYKQEFVNHEIRQKRQGYKYSDFEITQNEMFALGKTILYLALSNQVDKNTFIMDIDKKSQKQLIEQQNNHFYQLSYHEDLSQNYPKLRKIILKLMYPFQDVPDINDEENEKRYQEIMKKNKIKAKKQQNVIEEEEIDEDNANYKEPNKQKKIKKDNEIHNIQNNQNRFMAIEEVKQNDQLYQQTIEMKTFNHEGQQTLELRTVALATNDKEIMDQDDQDNNQEDLDDSEEDEDYCENQDEIKQKKKKQEKKVNRDQDIDDILNVLIIELSSVLFEKFKNENNYSQVIEQSNEIKVAILKIRQNRIDQLLFKHDDPQRELIFLSTMSEEDWRKEIAQNMIQDVLNSQANTGIQKYNTQKLIHEKILRIQKRIIEKQINIEDSFIDAIKDLYNICKKNKEYHSLIECIFSLYLIYHFLSMDQEAKKQIESAVQKVNFDSYAAKYEGTFTKNKIKEAQNNNINRIGKLIEIQQNDLRNNDYDIIY